MTEVFLMIVNMSISAGWLVLAVLVLRLILKKAPRWIHVLLWGIVAVRLICPFSIESALSLIPSRETISPEIMLDRTPEISTGIESLDRVVNPVISTSFAPEPIASANPLQIWIPVLSVVWAVGVAVMLAYALISYLRLKKRVATAFPIGKNIRQSEFVDSPFVLGLIRPVIYLPFRMESADMEPVIAHELTHIRRKDHWWKPLGYALLAIHWFNPLMWVAYILLCRDIELACDEKVIAGLNSQQRADYTQALVACSVNRRIIAACPLAFGEVGVKDRVRSIMNYRKPTFWIVVTALVMCVVVAVCFLTDPNPSRAFSMNGKNVASLDPEAIVERVLDIEDITNSGIHMNSLNFSLQVDSDFNWADSQTVAYFFKKNGRSYRGQLRIFPEEDKYLLTEPTEWHEEERIFLLRHYLEAVKYLPQYEIQRMAPADRYIIQHIDGGWPSDYERVITYSAEGVQELDSWFIHLQIQPFHAEGDGYRGSGDEVIELFYGGGGSSDDLNIFEGELHLGLNAEIVEIDSAGQIIIVKDIDENAAVFGIRSVIDCSYAISRGNLIYVNYADENDVRTIDFEDFEVGDTVIISLYDNQKRQAFNFCAVAEQIQLATQRLDPADSTAQMQPTETNLRGLVAGYLFTPISGATYRYAVTDASLENVTADQLLDTFTEETPIEGIVWEVYSLKEYPDKSKLLLRSGVGSAWLCEYAPAGQAEEGALEAVKAEGYVVEEDGRLTSGQDALEAFYQATRNGTPAFLRVAHYYTLDPDRTASDTYEACRQDSPALYIHELSYDGEQFVLRTEDDVRVYEYLMKYPGTETRYVLTHDNTVTWEKLWNGLISSAYGAYIDHYTICTARS